MLAARPGLLNLPLELKQNIFRPLLVAGSAFNLELLEVEHLPDWWMHVKGINPGIMYVYTALRRTAATVLYQENTFRFWSPVEAHRFAKLENAEEVRSFIFMVEDPVTATWCRYFEGRDPAFSCRNDFLQVNDLNLVLRAL